MNVFHKIFLLLALALFVLAPMPVHAEIEQGDIAPGLIVKTFDGRDFDLEKAKGKIIIVNFWATWCAACREEIPELSAFYRAYHDAKGVEMVSLSVDRMADRKRAEEVARDYHLPAAMMSDAATKFTMPELIPTTYVIDAGGVVQAKLIPDQRMITQSTLAEIVDPFSAAKPAATANTPEASASKPKE